MPIKPEDKARYPANWREISTAAKERAGWKCETCKAPHGEVIARGRDGTYMLPMTGETYDAETGVLLGHSRGSEYRYSHMVRVVLTTAHLDHTPENCADENLRVLCQLHHLRLDAKQHTASAAATRRARKASGDLFEASK